MSKSIKLPQSAFVCEMKHKHAVGDKVRVTKPHMMSGAEGEICALVPHTFIAPGYYVRINGMTTAVSERSIERIEHENS